MGQGLLVVVAHDDVPVDVPGQALVPHPPLGPALGHPGVPGLDPGDHLPDVPLEPGQQLGLLPAVISAAHVQRDQSGQGGRVSTGVLKIIGVDETRLGRI